MRHNPQLKKYVEEIDARLPRLGDIALAVEEFKDLLRGFNVLTPEVEADIEKAAGMVEARLSKIEVLRRISIVRTREEWYGGPGLSSKHWPALDAYLRKVKKWSDKAVDSIDETSNEIVSLLANPSGQTFRCRGLVVGYVQSGKTANMTAVIAKAVDSGYNLVVLLGGVTNKLRSQTQRRIEADILERHRELWQLYTTQEETGDFECPKNGSFTMPHDGGAQLAVIKKITSRLNAFHRTIKRTPKSILRKLKVLIIDDECDQASVNASNDDYNMTKINEAIRHIIRDLPAVSYVGYTATPFANVFINPFPPGKEELDDLYPEDFITALPRPEGYFGAREVFGDSPFDADNESSSETGRDMIRLVEEEELKMLQPQNRAGQSGFRPEMPNSLEEAILWFLASCGIRRFREQNTSHMSMLVHTSPFVALHQRTADLIERWINTNSADLASGTGAVTERFRRLVDEELRRVPPEAEIHKVRPDEKQLLPFVREALESLEIIVENSVSEIRLDYTGEKGKPKTYIVVGGTVLARGLTLEGLSVSYFLRTSRQYDSLLQMGRWFGYRFGYEDLPRLWTTGELASSFSALSHIEDEIREEIEKYRKLKSNPMEFAVKVRAIPGMAITSATKMRHAHRTSISFDGRHVQTIRFDHLDADVVMGNWNTAARLIDAIGVDKFGEVKPKGARLAKGVQVEKIRQFLSDYDISNAHMDLRKDLLLGYLDKSSVHLPLWNVAVASSKVGRNSTRNLGGLGHVVTLQRSKLKHSGGIYADIKALMSKKDVLIDVETPPADSGRLGWEDLKAARPPIPLMVLYPIDANSKPATEGSREPLNAVGDLLGIGIVFPGEIDRAGNYFEVNLEAPTPEEMDQEDKLLGSEDA